MRLNWSRFAAVQSGIVLGCALGLALFPLLSEAVITTLNTTQIMSDFKSTPLSSVNSASPIVMLTLSHDHQLHQRAYNDYSDLNRDGIPETTYSQGIDYYGYFDAYKCYTYDTATNRYLPAVVNAKDPSTPASSAANKAAKYCSPTASPRQWSGNFLNWATMTRMDALRKVLYGGDRSTDTATLTVLERDYLPYDGHAFVKYYDGTLGGTQTDDLANLTPFDPPTLPTNAVVTSLVSGTYSATPGISSNSCSGAVATVTTAVNHNFATGEYVLIAGAGGGGNNGVKQIIVTAVNRFTYSGCTSNGGGSGTAQLVLPFTPTASAPLAEGDQIKIAASATLFLTGVVKKSTLIKSDGTSAGSVVTTGLVFIQNLFNIFTTGTPDGSTALTVTDLTQRTGISLCNLTLGSTDPANANHLSQTNTNPPTVRVARGNYMLWGANEAVQCQWYGERNNTQSGYPSPPGIGSNGNSFGDSGLTASAENPDQTGHGLSSGSGVGEFTVRVQVCASIALVGQERCQEYPTVNATYPGGVMKPIGLLQTYGEDGRILFGLVTTSHSKNISGGVLRRNAASMGSSTTPNAADEVNASTDGTFTSTQGVVYNFDHERIYGYGYETPGYNSADSCGARLAGIVHSGGAGTTGNYQNEGNCSNWGNPISEAYIESLRFLAGQTTATSAFTYGAGSPDATLTLTTATPVDPLNSTNYCAGLNTIVINPSVNSYDDDQLAGMQDLAGATATTAKTQTTSIGDQESISGNNWFVGSLHGSGTAFSGAGDGQCTSKSISDLSAVSGICPEAPNQFGTYNIAGAAYYAHTNIIRAKNSLGNDGLSLSVPPEDTTSLKVTTYGVQLATNTPRIEIPVSVGGRKVVILPASSTDLFNDRSKNVFGPGTIMDFKIITRAADGSSGSYYINWENSTQGSDYDQDVWGILSYQVSGTTLTVTTNVVSLSAGASTGFGYILSGTNHDGLHIHSAGLGTSGTEAPGFLYTDPNPPNSVTGAPAGTLNASGGCQQCVTGDPSTTATYTITGNAAGLLQDPLYYASKYGGFDDLNANSRPDQQAEWDSLDDSGAPNPDGLPDTFFYVSDANRLESALDTAFRLILAKTASGTAAAVVANAREGEGAIYQAIYEPLRTDSKGRKTTWIGTLHALLIDKNGLLREDGNGNARLDFLAGGADDFATDPAISIYFDKTDRTTKFNRCNGDPAKAGVTCSTHQLNASVATASEQLKTLWNARTQLSSLTNASVLTQRAYTANANTGRYMLTWVDLNNNGVVDSGEVKDFTPASFPNGSYGILNVTSAADATKLVNYTRGDDGSYPDLRNRTVDYNNDGTVEVERLGDIVDSTPTVVGAPAEAFDLLYNDSTYGTFRKKWVQRRNVVYVGANDGMLHAFNGGFFDPSTTGFKLSGANSETAHPLGSELWAYVPYNLLPHLGWLSNPTYGHSWYVDGKPRVFDARIYPSKSCTDTVNPCGWATVLVVGMRFGGTSINLPVSPLAGGTSTSTAWSSFSNLTNPLSSRSAYLLLDITNPEAPPKLLAELTDATGSLGFTTSYPTAAAFSATNNTSTSTFTSENWYLVFGSGPGLTTLNSAVSTTTGKVYVYDLVAGAFKKASAGVNYLYDLGSTNAANSIVADPATVDWDLNFKADAVYFGTIGATISGTPSTTTAETGKLFKLDFNNSAAHALGSESGNTANWVAPVVMLDPGRPVSVTPSLTQDEQGRHWILAGTGRFLADPDKRSSLQESLFGVIDTLLGTSASSVVPSYSNLVNVTSAKVEKGTGKVFNVTQTMGGATLSPAVTTETGLINAVASTSPQSGGWARNLVTAGSTPSERNLAPSAALGGALFATAFTPNNTQCAGEGNSKLFCLSFKTGAANATGICGSALDTGLGKTIVNNYVDLGAGLGASPSLHATVSTTSGKDVSIITQTSTGAITTNQATVGGGVRSGEIDWREIHQ